MLSDEEVWVRFVEVQAGHKGWAGWVDTDVMGFQTPAKEDGIADGMGRRADILLAEYRKRFPKDSTPYRGNP